MATLVFVNAVVRTQHAARPLASAVAVNGRRIEAVGEEKEVRALAGARAEIIDLGGRLLLPGFAESHIHYFDWAIGRQQLVLTGVPSLAELLARVRAAAAAAPRGAWITGQGFEESAWSEARTPLRADLDAAAPDNPVLLFRSDLHLAVANSAALALAEVNRHTPDPAQGIFGRTSEGRLNGVLKDLAINPVKGVMLAGSDEAVTRAMAAAMPTLHAHGITTVHDFRLMGGSEGPQALRAWQRLEGEGRLALRAWVCLPGDLLDEAIALGLRTGLGSARLKLGHVKFFADGSMGAGTAWLLERYADGGSGIPLTPVPEIKAAVQRAERAGLAVAVHAIGDRANRDLAAALQSLARQRDPAMPLPAAPHRVEHVQMIRDEDLVRLAASGVHASVQPLQATDDLALIERNLGEQGRLCYRFRDLLAHGLPLAFGSDCPVADPSPLRGVHAAVTRQRESGEPAGGWHPEQRLSVAEAVRAYTAGPAAIAGRLGELGVIAPGALADLVVLSEDIYRVAPADIPAVSVCLTVFDGRVVYENL